jgi:hypothetical protein
VNIYKQSTMYLCILLIIVFCQSSLAMLQFPYPKQTFELRNHPSNWICTVHVTAATFANYTTSDITERFLASNRLKIIPTLSTMQNRSISIVPVISFFEPCTISILIDAIEQGSSYVFKKKGLDSYISGNEYVYRGWKHSIIILIYFSCHADYIVKSLSLPHRLFYHSLDCGHQNIFPNQVFVPDPLQKLRNITDPKYSIHYRQLPSAIRRSISTPKYGWDRHFPNIKPDQCLASRWDELSQMLSCPFDIIAVHHYQLFLNFTTFQRAGANVQNFGELFTNSKYNEVKSSISFHAIDSMYSRAIYCDRVSDSPALRPIRLSSPCSLETWVTLVFLLIFCAIASSFDVHSVAKNWTNFMFIKTILNSLFELIMCLLEKDVSRRNLIKTLIGLIAICLGNDYKNYLTIELVYPRAGDAISNFTELLDLNFNLLEPVSVLDIGDDDKSTWLKSNNYHLEIDKTKREKYIREAKRWLKLFLYNENYEETIANGLASVTSKNAHIINAPYFLQVYHLNRINQRLYPLSCHFVKRPLSHIFQEFFFLNPKAEEFKWLTAKFLDHGLFEFWKSLQSHMQTLNQRRLSVLNRSKMSNASSTGVLDIQNFVGQVHLIVFYIVIAILTAICVAIFILECAMQNAQVPSLFVLQNFAHYSLQFLWTIVRSLFLMRRRIGRLRQNSNHSTITPELARIDNISIHKIHKIEVKPQQQ